MPRNASGVYTLPSGNPVIPGTTIDAAWANDTMEDMANEITNSLSRTGAGGMLAPFRLADGTVTAPGVAWLNETNSGLYRSGAGSTWMSILGVNTIQFSTVGVTIPFGKALTAQGNASVSGTLAVTGATTLGSTLAVTGAITATSGVVGNVTGNVTAASGTSTFNNVTISGALDMDAGSSATITGLSTPTNSSDAANKGYVDAQVATRLALAGGTMTGYINMNGYDIVGVPTPTDPAMAANKAYVDSMAQGIDAKASCKIATETNTTLSGGQIIQGVALVAGDRVLVKSQTNAAENGIYTVASGVWPRAADANTWDELVAAYTFIEQGTNANNGYVCTVTAGGTLGTTPVTWAQFSGAGQIDAGAGLTKTGNQLNVGTASSSRIVVNTDNIDLATTGVTGGTYRSVTVDAYGRVTAGTNPTTLAGYGITDAYTTTQVDTALALKLNLTGGTMSGAIAMGANKITGMADPTNPQDAATKSYIDTIFGSTTSAAASASAAAASASAASTSATNAATSASNAATSATNAATTYTNFNNQYLGSKTSDPTVNNTGGALVAGNLYWNSTVSEMRVYNGSAWVAAYLPAAGYLALSGGTMTGVITFASAQTFDGAKVSGNISGNAATATYATSAGSATTATNVSGGTASVTTLTASSTVTLSAGTAQNIPYLNASKQLAYNANFVLDTSGNLGVGTSAPKVRVQWSAAAAENAPVLGSAKGIAYFTNNDANYGLLVGNSSATGAAWFQSQRTDGTATAYDIQLNPVGGNVLLGANAVVTSAGALGFGGTPSYGTSGQVLTSAGSGAAPTWTTVASSPLVLISTQTASSSSTLTWTGLSGYNRYLLVFDNLLAASSTSTLNFTLGTGSTPTYITSNYTEMTIRGQGAAPTGNGGTGRSSGYLTDFGSVTTLRLSGYCVFNGMTSLNQVSAISTWNLTTSGVLGGGSHFNQVSSGGAAITAIKINFASGNISSGNATLYGLTS